MALFWPDSFVKMIFGTRRIGFWDFRKFGFSSRPQNSDFKKSCEKIIFFKKSQIFFKNVEFLKKFPKILKVAKNARNSFLNVFWIIVFFYFTCLKCLEKKLQLLSLCAPRKYGLYFFRPKISKKLIFWSFLEQFLGSIFQKIVSRRWSDMFWIVYVWIFLEMQFLDHFKLF